MSVSLHVGVHDYPIGAGDFFNSFFSTVCVRLEASTWGSRFPTVMRDLYAGGLKPSQVELAMTELEQIEGELTRLRPDELVWDVEDRTAIPPWGTDISPEITSLRDYFVTMDGKDLLDVLDSALSDAQREGKSVAVY
jgi:2,3-bisphosphoglycerate-dependent phosphoglycerate mutase